MSAITRPPPLAIKSTGQGLPSRMIFYGVPGIGKTSIAAFAPKPIFVMTHRENGLETLLDAGLLPPTDHYPEVNDWPTLLEVVADVLHHHRGHRTLVLDAVNGAQQLCFDYVTRNQFKGESADFSAYGRGPEVSVAEWAKLVALLHRINAERRMSIVCLAHCRVKKFNNPEGDDYERYSPEMHEKIWGVVEKWADMVLFANYLTVTSKKNGAVKGQSAGARFIYTQRTAAYDAKNRYSLPQQISMGSNPQEAWQNLANAVKAARRVSAPVTNGSIEQSQQPDQPPTTPNQEVSQ